MSWHLLPPESACSRRAQVAAPVGLCVFGVSVKAVLSIPERRVHMTQSNPSMTTVASARAAAKLALSATPQTAFDQLPDAAMLRISQFAQSPKHPDNVPILPFGASTVWRLVAAKKFPQPIRCGARITAWKVGDLRQWLDSAGSQPLSKVGVQ